MSIFKDLFGGRKQNNKVENNNASIIGKWFSLDSIKTIGCGSFMLVPYDAKWFTEVLDGDSLLLHHFGNSERITKFLDRDFSSPEKVKEYLKKAMFGTELGYSITYVIRGNNYPLGMIIVNTPSKNEHQIDFNEWTMDFFMVDGYDNKGIMSLALPRILKALKEDIHVNSVYFIVDPRNEPCLALLNKFPLDEIVHRADMKAFYHKVDHTKARLFCCNLATLQFKHR